MKCFDYFNHTVIGAKHIKNNTVCQDCSDSFQIGDMIAITVCDGHGGANYIRSDRGSRFACDAFKECVTNEAFLESLSSDAFVPESDSRIRQLITSIIAKWNELVYSDFSSDPFQDDELRNIDEKYQKRYLSEEYIEKAYGTTLIGIVFTPGFWFGIHIGDGKCVVIEENGVFTQPIPWDDNCFLNQTTSMCDSNVYEEFRYYISRDLPKAIFIASDGIDDCFAAADIDKANSMLHGFYKTVAVQFAQNDIEKAKSDLFSYLPVLSTKGSGDDMSIAAILSQDELNQLIQSEFAGESKANEAEIDGEENIFEEPTENIDPTDGDAALDESSVANDNETDEIFNDCDCNADIEIKEKQI